MKTIEDTPVDPEVLADLEEVCRAKAAQRPLDPELRKRIQKRADEVRAEIHRTHGVQDVMTGIIRDLRDNS
jgi:hypothetical protein